MTVKPVKFISDVQTKKEIIKTDITGTVLFHVSGTVPFGHVSSSLPITASGLFIDGHAKISGSALINLSSSGPIHDIYEVFSNIDTALSGAGATYRNIQEIHTGSFEANGSKDIQLFSYSVADFDYIGTDVMIKYSGSAQYKNDLIDVELSGNIAADKIHVLFYAPALSSFDSYRLVVNRQSGSVIT